MKARPLIVSSAVLAVVAWLLLRSGCMPQEVDMEKSIDPPLSTVAVAEQGDAASEMALVPKDSHAVVPLPEVAAPAESKSLSDMTGKAQPAGHVSLTDYDFVADVVRSPRAVDVELTNTSRQLNPKGLMVPAWVVKKVTDDVLDAQRRVLDLLNQLGAVRGVEMSDLKQKGALRPLDRSVAPELYDAELAVARQAYMRENPQLVLSPGWEGEKQFQKYLNNRLINALAMKSEFTQAILGPDGSWFVARVADLPKFHQLLKDGAIEGVAADLCVKVLDHYRTSGLLSEQERGALWARVATLLGDKIEKLAR